MGIKERVKDSFLMDMLFWYRLRKQKKIWRKRNPHNTTKAKTLFNCDLVHVGNKTYGDLNIISFNNKTKLSIGSICSLAQDVHFLLDAEHPIHNISTFPFQVAILAEKEGEAFSKGDIVVDDDVWFGFGAVIMSGVHIGQGAVIAAGSVVTKDIPPYAIVGGVPARVIKYRFSAEMISELLKLDYNKLTEKMISAHSLELYTKLTDIGQLEWFPQKQ